MLLTLSVFFAALAALVFAAMSYDGVSAVFTTVGLIVVVVYTANVFARWFLHVLPKDVVSSEGKAVIITGKILKCSII